MHKIDTKRLTTISLLIALEIVLSRFCSISAWNLKIGFSFVPVVVAAILYGPLQAGIVGGVADFIGAILFPIGIYFPGFTLTAFLTGIIFGIFLHKEQNSFRIGGAVVLNQLGCSLLINSLWISILYTSPYLPLLSTRIVQCVILGPIQFIMISAMVRVLGYCGKKVLL